MLKDTGNKESFQMNLVSMPVRPPSLRILGSVLFTHKRKIRVSIWGLFTILISLTAMILGDIREIDFSMTTLK
ncbi:MAG: hypothetical protein CO119_02260 [Flavobacteriales bacterium CG_4_9_14_3_um_filter_40_17]|nr:MAG: hypothetical protein CO119_02260 [Flavobacteriales bacterium CG_4_9_14_3_um_filter_40_17]